MQLAWIYLKLFAVCIFLEQIFIQVYFFFSVQFRFTFIHYILKLNQTRNSFYFALTCQINRRINNISNNRNYCDTL